MSIRRIESAYATFLDDKEMSASEMSVLVALAYVANEKRDEDCFPSDRYLRLLTHLGDKTIRTARNNLRKRKVINWISGGLGRQGGNVSNRYKFLFPHLKMPSQRDRYQPVETPPVIEVDSPTVTATAPTVTATAPYGQSDRTLRSQQPTNTEITTKKTSESNTEKRGVPNPLDSEFKFDFGFGELVRETRARARPVNPDEEGPLQKAMRVCGVDDEENWRTFSSVMVTKNPVDCMEEVCTFESEVKQGEHKNAVNLAAILTKRLKGLRDLSSQSPST